MTPADNDPVDPMADPSLTADPPGESEAVAAARQMNDPDGRQPGASEKEVPSDDDDPLPETMS